MRSLLILKQGDNFFIFLIYIKYYFLLFWHYSITVIVFWFNEGSVFKHFISFGVYYLINIWECLLFFNNFKSYIKYGLFFCILGNMLWMIGSFLVLDDFIYIGYLFLNSVSLFLSRSLSVILFWSAIILTDFDFILFVLRIIQLGYVVTLIGLLFYGSRLSIFMFSIFVIFNYTLYSNNFNNIKPI